MEDEDGGKLDLGEVVALYGYKVENWSVGLGGSIPERMMHETGNTIDDRRTYSNVGQLVWVDSRERPGGGRI